MELSTFVNGIMPHQTANVPKPTADIGSLSVRVTGAVESFLTANELVVRPNLQVAGQVNHGLSLESLAGNQSFSESLGQLLASSGIPTDLQPAATHIVANIIGRYVSQNDIVGRQFASNDAVARREGFIGLESLFGSANRAFVGAGIEAFGVNVTQTVPDLKSAISVALMAFHTAIGPRMMPVRSISEPSVRIDVDRMQVFDLDSPTASAKNLIELHTDPSLVSNTLRAITVLAANDGEDDVLVANDRIRFGKDANILELAIDATDPAIDRVNHTDLVADDVRLANVYMTITNNADPAVTETYILVPPTSKARYTRLVNSTDAADRAISMTHEFFLTKGSLMSNDSASVLLNGLTAATEGVKFTLRYNGTINIRTGVSFASCTVAMAAHNPAGGAISGGLTALVATLTTVAVTSYSLDARYDEQNKRRSSIVSRILRRSLEYEVPVGRNYICDFEQSQQDDSTVTNLSKLLRLGEDAIVVAMISATVTQISNELTAIGQGLNSDFTLGQYYAAGQLINPYIYTGTLDMSDITSVRDADRCGDVKQRAIQYLTGVIATLQQNSLIASQMPAGIRPTWRVLTSPLILDSIIGLPHIHNHLNKGVQVSDSSGVEYRLVLDNGVTLEFVTTTFTSMKFLMAVIPYMPNAPESVLNFGLLADYGTLVGTYQSVDGRGTARRVYASTRQQPIPLCPIAAMITVAGIDEAMFLSTGG